MTYIIVIFDYIIKTMTDNYYIIIFMVIIIKIIKYYLFVINFIKDFITVKVVVIKKVYFLQVIMVATQVIIIFKNSINFKMNIISINLYYYFYINCSIALAIIITGFI